MQASSHPNLTAIETATNSSSYSNQEADVVDSGMTSLNGMFVSTVHHIYFIHTYIPDSGARDSESKAAVGDPVTVAPPPSITASVSETVNEYMTGTPIITLHHHS